MSVCLRRNFNISLLMCHWTLSLDIGQESKQNLTGLCLSKRFPFTETLAIINKEKKREKSWQLYFYEEMVNEIP